MPLASRLARTGSVAAMAVVALALAACSAVVTDADRAAKQSGSGGGSAPVATAAPSFDLTTKNLAERPHTKPVAEAVQALEQSGFRPVQAGKLTVALGGAGAPPTSFFAEDDAQTIIGSDPDLASLIAEGLGLEYAPENVAWADWPLGIESGKYDLALTNIGVTEERKELFDFATYRDAVMGFVVADGSAVKRITEPKDVSGLKVVVGSGTNQEKFLLDWIAQNRKAGLPPGEAVYFDDFAAGQLALKSGRVDASILPYSLAKFQEQTAGETRVVGKFNSAYPVSGEVGTVSAKGSGLAKPVQIVIQHLIDDGTYAKVLQRWGQSEEAVRTSQLNPPGLPKP
ncbi:amino acid ABC transporter substrate-binding protein [Leucobacter sp. Ag1]|uniref:ABC transporter substrate-binding protein n=1 Tax=Leucobacter sp. Ag1 TaxID=1642040 RepID=UPI0006215DC3|nr:ABC transporter substrate-binding protein [Leucobacter sp. Ag1]KKI22284.1 amino acid ABC transporter substrate-binding protein [Leucobacter sp. Ag1]